MRSNGLEGAGVNKLTLVNNLLYKTVRYTTYCCLLLQVDDEADEDEDEEENDMSDNRSGVDTGNGEESGDGSGSSTGDNGSGSPSGASGSNNLTGGGGNGNLLWSGMHSGCGGRVAIPQVLVWEGEMEVTTRQVHAASMKYVVKFHTSICIMYHYTGRKRRSNWDKRVSEFMNEQTNC